MIRVMVKHAGSNTETHAEEFCRVDNANIAGLIVRQLADQKMKVYDYPPGVYRKVPYRLVPRYLRVYTVEENSVEVV